MTQAEKVGWQNPLFAPIFQTRDSFTRNSSMTPPTPFQTLLWRRFVLFLAAIIGIVTVAGGFWLSIPFWAIAVIVQDWELREKEHV